MRMQMVIGWMEGHIVGVSRPRHLRFRDPTRRASAHSYHTSSECPLCCWRMSTFTAPDVDEIRAKMLALPGWYHDIDLGNGLVTPGRGLHSLWDIDRRLMNLIYFHDKSVLDVGPKHGMWSFDVDR